MNKIKTGDIVVANGAWINPLKEYIDESKSLPIDINWKPGFLYPEIDNTNVFLNKGDILTILSDKAFTAENYTSYIYYVKDKNENCFYLSALFFE